MKNKSIKVKLEHKCKCGGHYKMCGFNIDNGFIYKCDKCGKKIRIRYIPNES